MDPTHVSLSRRDAIKTAIGAGAVLLGGPRLLGPAQVDDALAAGACTLTPEQEEGPFYVALNKVRSNIRGTRQGVPLTLRITIIDSSSCKPVKGAAVDLWHADAAGHYSDESSEDTVGQTWLRGVQLTNASGLATFRTIYPGFYSGRTTHIHVKVHTGGHVSHTGQIFFPEALSTKVYRTAEYLKDTNERTLRKNDHVYTGQHGSQAIMRVTGGSVGQGVRGAITLAVDPSASR